jgi:hypothetical protein
MSSKSSNHLVFVGLTCLNHQLFAPQHFHVIGYPSIERTVEIVKPLDVHSSMSVPVMVWRCFSASVTQWQPHNASCQCLVYCNKSFELFYLHNLFT